MRHFVAYHNVERMGRSLEDGDPLRVLSKRSVQKLLHNTVWFVVGRGESPKTYSLGSVFIVSELGETGQDEFKHFARGQGHVFQPQPVLNDLDWFRGFFKDLAHFSLGVQEVKEPRYIEELQRLALQGGAAIATEPPNNS
jgi:hypothetical protein